MKECKKIFIGGPIQFAFDEEGRFDSDIENSILLMINELTKTDYKLFSAHIAEKFGKLTEQLEPLQICYRDFKWMQSCDIYVSLLPFNIEGDYLRSDGTYVEMGWASAYNKPILLLLDISRTNKLSSLVQGLGAICNLYLYDTKDLNNTGNLVKYIDSIMLGTSNPVTDMKVEVCNEASTE